MLLHETEELKATGMRQMIEDSVLVGGLIAAQIVNAGITLFSSYLMKLDLNPLTMIIFSTFSTSFLISPFIYFERNQWPINFSFRLFFQLLLMSFAGVVLLQTLYLEGIKLASPTIATAMLNLVPGLIFIISAVFRLEKVKLSCIYSKLKIMGALLCVMGALTMSIMQGDSPLPKEKGSSSDHLDSIIGSIYIMADVFVISFNSILQAKTLVEFPAPISICAITSFFGASMALGLTLVQNQKLDVGLIPINHLIGYFLLVGMIGGVCFSLYGWATKEKGPVFVSMFSPISTVVSAIVSFFTIGEVISIPSWVGMVAMFMGLYIFLWAKNKEELSHPQPISRADNNVENPLLS